MKYFTKEAASASVKWLKKALSEKPLNEVMDQAKKMNLPPNKRVDILGGGGEGVASIVTHPKKGLQVEKAYDMNSPFVSAQSLRSKQLLTNRVVQKVKDLGKDPDDYIVAARDWKTTPKKAVRSYSDIAQSRPEIKRDVINSGFVSQMMGIPPTKIPKESRAPIFKEIKNIPSQSISGTKPARQSAMVDVNLLKGDHNIVNGRIIDFLPGNLQGFSNVQRIKKISKKDIKSNKLKTFASDKKVKRRNMEFKERLTREAKATPKEMGRDLSFEELLRGADTPNFNPAKNKSFTDYLKNKKTNIDSRPKTKKDSNKRLNEIWRQRREK